MKKTIKNSGNALWFILIAIFLLAALTMLITKTSTQTEETGEAERISVAVSKLMRYTSSVSSTVQNMLMRGVSENQLSFANTIYQECDDDPLQPAGHNPNCTTGDCEIFGAQGGGLKPMEIPEILLAQYPTCSFWKVGATAIGLKRVEGLGTGSNDDLLLEVVGLTKEACIQINRTLNIPTVSDDAPADDFSGGSLFTGTYTQFGPQIGNEYAGFIGKKVFCAKNPSGYYSFFTVLVVK